MEKTNIINKNIPKYFVLKKVMENTAWHVNKDGVFQSLDDDVELKDSDVFYKTNIVDGKVKQLSISVKELKEIIKAHSHVLNHITNGWYENNN